MNPQTSDLLSAFPATEHQGPSEAMRAWRRQPAPPSRFAYLRRPLLAFGLLLSAVVLGMGAYLLGFAAPSAARTERSIAVPYAGNGALWEPLRRWPVQEDGRVKPFETFCREAVRSITGRERFEGNDPVAVVASWLLLYDPKASRAIDLARQMGVDWEEYPFVLCDNHALRELLFREYRGPEEELTDADLHGKYVAPAVLRGSSELKKLLRSGAERMEQDAKAVLSPLEAKATEVKKRLALYERIRGGGQEGRQRVHAAGEFGVVALDAHGPTWFSLRSVREYVEHPERWEEALAARRVENPSLYEAAKPQPLPAAEVREVAQAAAAWQQAYLAKDEEQLAAAMNDFLEVVGRVAEPYREPVSEQLTERELWFNRTNPFRQAWLASLLAAFLLGVGVLLGARWATAGRAFRWTGMVAYAGCLAWSVAGFWCRVTISGRPPVSNMYESVIWVAFMTAAFGLVLEFVYRSGVLALAGALVSTLGFVLADQLPLTLAPNIQPLQAVLRSNYWLVIHVLTIVSSYAAFALAWGLGNLNLGLILFAPGRRDLIQMLSGFCYRAIQIGVVLLAAGTLLGGFWAAESWGRFWGWDPKEVWALIALLCYVIPLHARYVGWVKEFGLAVCSVVCFASVVMAWYGVNFVLGAGLHSYGFGGGNDAWVYWGGLLNVNLAVYAGLRYLSGASRVAPA
jgi:ABC-type transport system involved in cytochrome c biogenesis permease subunit